MDKKLHKKPSFEAPLYPKWIYDYSSSATDTTKYYQILIFLITYMQQNIKKHWRGKAGVKAMTKGKIPL